MIMSKTPLSKSTFRSINKNYLMEEFFKIMILSKNVLNEKKIKFFLYLPLINKTKKYLFLKIKWILLKK